MKFTPGPWFIDRKLKGLVCTETKVICKTKPYGSVESLGLPNDEVCERNAKLISAAPDLLAAVNLCHEVLWNGYAKDSVAWVRARTACLTAISKAYGERK